MWDRLSISLFFHGSPRLFFMDSSNEPPAFSRRPLNASSPPVPSSSRGARRTVAGSDTNDTDLRTTSPQKLANEMREPLILYID